jgi:hypothetical protein
MLWAGSAPLRGSWERVWLIIVVTSETRQAELRTRMRTFVGEPGVLPGSWSEVAIPMVLSLDILVISALHVVADGVRIALPSDRSRAVSRNIDEQGEVFECVW